MLECRTTSGIQSSTIIYSVSVDTVCHTPNKQHDSCCCSLLATNTRPLSSFLFNLGSCFKIVQYCTTSSEFRRTFSFLCTMVNDVGLWILPSISDFFFRPKQAATNTNQPNHHYQQTPACTNQQDETAAAPRTNHTAPSL